MLVLVSVFIVDKWVDYVVDLRDLVTHCDIDSIKECFDDYQFFIVIGFYSADLHSDLLEKFPVISLDDYDRPYLLK